VPSGSVLPPPPPPPVVVPGVRFAFCSASNDAVMLACSARSVVVMALMDVTSLAMDAIDELALAAWLQASSMLSSSVTPSPVMDESEEEDQTFCCSCSTVNMGELSPSAEAMMPGDTQEAMYVSVAHVHGLCETVK
jgi:hypothetical protein